MKRILVLLLAGIFLSKTYALSLSYDPFKYSGSVNAYSDEELPTSQYLQARYYDMRLMRFDSRDSYKLMNRYGYGNANPIMNVDPTGHIGFVGALLIGASLLSDILSDGLAEVGAAIISPSVEIGDVLGGESGVNSFEHWDGLANEMKQKILSYVPSKQLNTLASAPLSENMNANIYDVLRVRMQAPMPDRIAARYNFAMSMMKDSGLTDEVQERIAQFSARILPDELNPRKEISVFSELYSSAIKTDEEKGSFLKIQFNYFAENQKSRLNELDLSKVANQEEVPCMYYLIYGNYYGSDFQFEWLDQ